MNWCRDNGRFVVGRCLFSLSQVISYPNGDFYSLSESFLEIVKKIPPISPTLKNCVYYISHPTV